MCREHPEAFSRVAKGELQLSVLRALRPHLNAENASELFTACSRKSFEQVEELRISDVECGECGEAHSPCGGGRGA